MYALNIIVVFIRDQVRKFPALHRRLTDVVYADILKRHPPVLSRSESIDIIVRDNASVARYGDGEYKLCRNKHLNFQQNSNELATRLREILYCDMPNFHAAVVPPNFGMEQIEWRNTLAHNYRIIAKLGDRPRLNAFVRSVHYQSDINQMKRIWHQRKVTLITNKETKQMAVDCDLFANASQLDFISAPSAEAFGEYQSILEQAKQRPTDTLFLLACGPTATVLAYELHLCGYQAVDIGHFIVSAMQFLKECGGLQWQSVQNSSAT